MGPTGEASKLVLPPKVKTKWPAAISIAQQRISPAGRARVRSPIRR